MDTDLAFKDQLDAEYREAESLVPREQNRRLWNHVRPMITRAFHQDDETDTFMMGAVPVIRYNGNVATVHRRDEDRPISSSIPLERCAQCYQAVRGLTPFWINAGTLIVQVELCRDCAVSAIDNLDAKPQIALSDLLS